MFLAAEITEAADVGDDEGGGEAILGAHLAEVDTAVFEGEAAAVAVVADLHELALEGLIGEVVADSGSEIESLARQVAVAEEGADLVGERLRKRHKIRRRHGGKVGLHRIFVEAEVGDGGEKFPVGLYFQKRADSDEALDLSIVLKDLLDVVATSGRDPEIAYDRRPIAGTECESKW